MGFQSFRPNSAIKDKKQGVIDYDPAGCGNIFTEEKIINP
jgi:hypothetical protein